jgi:hypothetical protein
MASGHVNRVNRPNTWLHRPMLQTFKKVLANSEPSTHGGKADMTLDGNCHGSRQRLPSNICKQAIGRRRTHWAMPCRSTKWRLASLSSFPKTNRIDPVYAGRASACRSCGNGAFTELMVELSGADRAAFATLTLRV